jgi:3-hydroxy-9,10-secoandrosta-1,3,5(10)-triene-9,17-dione monooxygenase reductase component
MNMRTIDPKRFRSVMGAFPTGVAVIATEWQGELFGATINSLTSVSLEPCMLLFCTNEGSATSAAIRKRGLF